MSKPAKSVMTTASPAASQTPLSALPTEVAIRTPLRLAVRTLIVDNRFLSTW